jgi:hypothetical protein
MQWRRLRRGCGPGSATPRTGANMKQSDFYQSKPRSVHTASMNKDEKHVHAQDMSSHIAANSLPTVYMESPAACSCAHRSLPTVYMESPAACSCAHRTDRASRRCLTVSRQTRMLCAPGEASPPGTHSVRGARCARAEGVGRRAAGRLSAYLLLQPAPLVSAVCEGTRVAWVVRRLHRRCGV